MTQITLQANHCWIDTSPANLIRDYGKFGIYILGIKSNHQEGRILPYYVGKFEERISERIKNHVNKIHSTGTTYTIFSAHFLRSIRGTNMDFIERIELPSKKYESKHYGKDIFYLNDRKFFKNLWIGDPKLQKICKEWPSKPFPLSLMDLSGYTAAHSNVSSALYTCYNKDNLFFTVINPNIIVDGKPTKNQKEVLGFLETFVKFSLKINTIGKSHSFLELQSFLTNYNVMLQIACPDIDREFHTLGSFPTDQSTILFP